ncbi:hypothetical protein L1F28_09595 [Arthrospira platensis NCB002]|uniref:hypothetical protein n=1 Tax=Limnospira platensis TaxID=118562 RepID=UPI0005BAB180|nr:hypothetical protein [Arthrospira platensis NCB002]
MLRLHGDEKHEVGRVVSMNYPSLTKYWKLNVEVTSPEIVLNSFQLKHEIMVTEPGLAFIDANHMHPWPCIDTISISQLLPKDCWILLQDTQVMERWLANCVEFGVPSPKPCRGVNLVTTLWPGSKIVGWDMCYNMGAIKLDVTDQDIQKFVEQAIKYPLEIGHNQRDECMKYISLLETIKQ